MKYILDTNICIYFMKGLFNLDKKIEKFGYENCYISEITLAELKFEVANSNKKEQNKLVLDDFIKDFKIIPIYNSLDLYSTEKARLRKAGKTVDDFDLLIGVTAIYNQMTLVTNNIKDFGRISNIKIQDWTKKQIQQL